MFEFDFNELGDTAAGDELIGSWVSFGRYGRKEYQIIKDEKGKLRFTGPDGTGGSLSGQLARSGEWYEATVKIDPGRKVGTIRLCAVEEEDGIQLNFRSRGEAEWGQDILARRVASAKAWSPGARAAEFLMEANDTVSLPEKERAELKQLAEKLNPRIDAAEHADKFGSFEFCHLDNAYSESAEALVLRPTSAKALPAPVILFLLGNGHVDARESIFNCGLDVLLQNEDVRKEFFIVVPKPCTKDGLVRYTGRGWEKEWNEDAVWLMLTKLLRKLGPTQVDPARLCATGISMGARGVWHLAIKYGEMLAAVAPISGQCYWPEDSWLRGPLPRPDIVDRLSRLPFRAYQIDVDNYAGNPLRDIEWLTYGLQESTRHLNLSYAKQKIEVQVREWPRGDGGATMELWWVRGPLDGEEGTDDHRLWLWVYEKRQWGLAQFFLKHRTWEENRWDFSSKLIHVDTSAQKVALEALWKQLEGTREQKNENKAKDTLVAELYGSTGASNLASFVDELKSSIANGTLPPGMHE